MIELKSVTKRFGSLVALHSLTLEIAAGEVFGFIGPNGAGKTTTMKILAGLLRPDMGRAKVDGMDVGLDTLEVRRIIGYMPDFLGVYEDLAVDEYLQFFAAAYKVPRAKRRSIIDSVLELTDLTEKRRAMVDSLSRGMQQRLGVARVLIHDPKVLLLDEPASGLDPRARIEMRELLTELGRMGKTLMISSHILSELAEMCTSIGIIERGRLMYAGSIEDAFARTSTGERIVIRLEEGGAGSQAVADSISGDERIARAMHDNGRLTVDLVPGQHGHHFLIERIIAAGGRIAAFTPEKVKLEDAFLRLTKGKVQ